MKLRWFAAFLALAFSAPFTASAQPTPPQTMVDLNGIEMHYREMGNGEPLLLLHGFGDCGAGWGSMATALSKHYRVIMPDLRGHGWSSNPANTFTMRQSGDDILALLDHLELTSVRAMGISAGGMTLLHAATRQPDRFEAMVLIGATPYFPEQGRQILRGAGWDTMPEAEKSFFRGCAYRGEEQAKQLVQQFGTFAHSYNDMIFTPPTLGTIKARTLIVHGDRDEFFPVALPVQMYESIPGSELWIVPNGDHVPIFGERAAEFLRVTQQFLAGANVIQGPGVRE
jgi:pimeloyl-ACP methyl ester carboxylesterase